MYNNGFVGSILPYLGALAFVLLQTEGNDDRLRLTTSETPTYALITIPGDNHWIRMIRLSRLMTPTTPTSLLPIPEPECNPPNFECHNKECIEESGRCDGINDCDGGEDEHSCEPECNPPNFECNSKECIEESRRCDGIEDCEGGEDEHSCTCTADEFKCRSDGKCINSVRKCNGDHECDDNSDEEGCEAWHDCEDTYVAAFRHTDMKNITEVVNKYNKEDLRIANVTFSFHKYEGDLMITHFTLSNVYCHLTDLLVNSFPTHLVNRSINLVYWRNILICDGVIGERFEWPRTLTGTSTSPDNPCEDEDGAPGPIRRCIGDDVNGAYWDTEPDAGKCRKPSERAERSRRIENVTVDPNSIGELLEVVTEGPPLSAFEVWLVSAQLKRVREMIGEDSLGSNQTLQDVADVAMRLLDAVLESGEKVLGQVEDSSGSITDMMESVAHILVASATSEPAINYGSHLSTFAVNEEGNVRGVMSKEEDLHSPQGMIDGISWDDKTDSGNFSQSLWGMLLMDNTELGDLGMAVTVFNSSDLFLDADLEDERISPIIGLNFFGSNKTTVDPGNSVLVMFSKDTKYAEEEHLCSQRTKHGGRGKWTQEGCSHTSNEIVPYNMIGCTCAHATNMAMLISHTDPFDDPALGLITKIGCSASFICVAFAFLSTAFNPKRFQTVYGKIELNLFLSVFLLDAITLLAMFLQYPAGGDACIAVGVILHYSVLATFTWMMLVGLMHMLRLTPKTLLSARNMVGNHLLLKATIFGWGLAAIPVIATVSVDTRHYVNELPIAFCYPHGIALYSAVIFPVALASVINTFIFIWVAVMLLCVHGIRPQGMGGTKRKMRRIYFLFFLFCLLGLYWIFGLLIVATSGHKRTQKILKYVFCVTAPLHGLLLFVFLVLCERNFRSKLRETFAALSRVFPRSTSSNTYTSTTRETARFHSSKSDLTGQSVSKVELQVSETTTVSRSK